MEAPAPPNRIVDFCCNAPAPAVVRAHVRVGDKLGDAHVDVERAYGPAPSGDRLTARFATMQDEETLVVAVAKDGSALGTAWPVYKDTVSLDFGIPDMTEGEAAGLLMSPTCKDGLMALRDRGVHPIAVSPSVNHAGCASCGIASSGSIDASSVILILAGAWIVHRLRTGGFTFGVPSSRVKFR